MIDGKFMEPVETLTIDTRDEYIGVLTEVLSNRQAHLTNMRKDVNINVRLEFQVTTKGLLGFRSAFLTATRREHGEGGAANRQILALLAVSRLVHNSIGRFHR